MLPCVVQCRAGRATRVGVVVLFAMSQALSAEPLGAAELLAPVVDPRSVEQPAPSVGGHCLECPDYDLFVVPTGAWQYHSGFLERDECDWFAFDASPRYIYEFSTCEQWGGGHHDFEPWVELWDESCTLQHAGGLNCRAAGREELEIVQPPAGRWFVVLRDFPPIGEPPVSNYTLAYRRTCIPDSTCSAPLAVIVPQAACHLMAGSLDFCSDTAPFVADLHAGCTYTFSFCPASCSGLPEPGATFDARLQLEDPFGSTVAVDGAACGNGEILYTVPPGGGGEHCVVVSRETPGGGDTFMLSYQGECEPPSALTVGPVAASASGLDCSRDQTFVADVVGLGPFTWEWSIASPVGGSANPASGTGATPGNHFEWHVDVQGAGVYQVEVTGTNVGGSVVATISYELEDDAPPQLVVTADPADCLGPFPIRHGARGARSLAPARSSRPRVERPLAAHSREEIETLMLSSPDAREAELRIAQRLGVDGADVRVEDRRVDEAEVGHLLPDALSCTTPCTGSATLSIENAFHELSLTCDEVGLIEDAHDGRACVFDPADTAGEPDSVGIEAEWTRTLPSGVEVRVREELVLFGASEGDAGMRLTLASAGANQMDVGQSFSRSVSILSARAAACAPVELHACPGDCVRLDAAATDNCGATLTYVGGSPGAPPCNGLPCVVEFPDEGIFEYAWEATDEAGHSVECSAIVTVELDGSCNAAPACAAGGPGASACRDAPIEGGSVDDADGDAIAWSWMSDNPDVTLDPPTGTLAAGVGARALPPVIARLAASASACNASANLTLTVDDGRGGMSSCGTSVSFHDDVAPRLGQGGAFAACLWPPNHWYACFTPEDIGLQVIDACSEPVTWVIARCASDQPDEARDRRWNGDGRTVDDCVVESDGHSFCVRSERAGTGPGALAGRSYAVAIVATDACGNISNELAVATIHVPHDQGPQEPGCIDVTHVGCRELPCAP